MLGVLKLGNVSLDGTKIHADASKHKAVSHQRLLELEAQLRQEVAELLLLGEQAANRVDGHPNRPRLGRARRTSTTSPTPVRA